MSEQENIIDENNEIVDETPQIEVPLKIKKPQLYLFQQSSKCKHFVTVFGSCFGF